MINIIITFNSQISTLCIKKDDCYILTSVIQAQSLEEVYLYSINKVIVHENLITVYSILYL